jgi:hypothetical protein
MRASREGSDHLGNLGTDRRMILKWILWKYSLRKWTVQFRIGFTCLTKYIVTCQKTVIFISLLWKPQISHCNESNLKGFKRHTVFQQLSNFCFYEWVYTNYENLDAAFMMFWILWFSWGWGLWPSSWETLIWIKLFFFYLRQKLPWWNTT